MRAVWTAAVKGECWAGYWVVVSAGQMVGHLALHLVGYLAALMAALTDGRTADGLVPTWVEWSVAQTAEYWADERVGLRAAE